MKYKDIKLAALQKMFHDVVDLSVTDVTKPFLDKMPYVVNAAIERVCAVGGAIRKYVTINHISPKNLIEKNLQNRYMITGLPGKVIDFKGEGAKAYYFEFCGKGSAKIYVDGVCIHAVNISLSDTYTAYKGKIPNSNNKTVNLVFEGSAPYLIKNPALYDIEFESDDDVLEYGKYISFNMKEEANDFYKFSSTEHVIEITDNDEMAYKFRDKETFEVRGDTSGSWLVPYMAYPAVIDENTSDEEEITLPYELCLILPFYIASELYLEDDSGLATMWRNKFESSLEDYTLLRNQAPKIKYHVVDMAGGKYDSV